MSKAQEDLLAKARRQANREQPEQAPVRDKGKPIRITLDLAPILHRDLVNWCADASEDLGVPRVPAAAVLRALLHELKTDPELTAKIRAQLPQELA